MLTDEQVAEAADALYQAELDNQPIQPISRPTRDADVDDAYRISIAVTEAEDRGRAHREGSQDRPHVEGHALAHRCHRTGLRDDVRRLVRARGRHGRAQPA